MRSSVESVDCWLNVWQIVVWANTQFMAAEENSIVAKKLVVTIRICSLQWCLQLKVRTHRATNEWECNSNANARAMICKEQQALSTVFWFCAAFDSTMPRRWWWWPQSSIGSDIGIAMVLFVFRFSLCRSLCVWVCERKVKRRTLVRSSCWSVRAGLLTNMIHEFGQLCTAETELLHFDSCGSYGVQVIR